MPRTDLLALTPDDLATLTNRGTLKRARREIEEKDCAAEVLETPEGDVTVKWSDGAECRLPAGATLREARCSCASAEVCRHLVRSVLAYQRHAAPHQTVAPAGPWDPGAIPDDELARHFRPAQLTKARDEFEQGVLVELVRSSKPSARFHLQACLLRFLVPGDVRYTRCDCARPAPCDHVPLAVWAFRQLPDSENAGIQSSSARALPVPAEALDRAEATLMEFCEQGVSGVPAGWKDRLARLAGDCETADLVWPAEVVSELAEQQERYDGHDARFAPDEVARLVGELLARCDAIRNPSAALPQLLVRGTKSDRATPLGKSTFVGLGCGVRASRRHVVLTAYLQDAKSGTITAVVRESAEEAPDPARPPRPFAELAQASACKGTSFAALGVGRLTTEGGRRTARCHLSLRGAKAGVTRQRFEWEQLRPPVFVEELAELHARLGALPPSALRPRRVAEDFHVCAVAGAEAVRFDSATQAVQATLLDSRGQPGLLVFPYTSRGRAGAEALLAMLAEKGRHLRFVSGPVRRGAGGLLIEPVCLVFEDGANRVALQPWVDGCPGAVGTASPTRDGGGTTDPLVDCLRQTQAGLEELLALGLRRADLQVARRWRELQERAEATGFARLALPARLLADELDRKAHDLRWDWRPAGRAALRLAVLLRLAEDLVEG